MRVKLEVWNRKVGNQEITVVGKKFYYKGEWYAYALGKEYVEIAHDF